MIAAGTTIGHGVGPRLRLFATTSAGMLALAALSATVVASMAAPVLCTPARGNATPACAVLSALQLTEGAAALAAVIATMLAAAAGILAAFLPRVARDALRVVLEGGRAVPALLVALGAAVVLGGGLMRTMVAIGAALVLPATCRVHGIVRRELAAPYVAAARGLALSPTRIVFAHVVPNALGPLTVLLLDQLALAVLLETTMSFLGLGLDARAASLGTLLATPRWPVALGLVIVLLASLRTLRRVLDRVQAAFGSGR